MHENYRITPHLFFDEHTALLITESQLLKINYKLPQYKEYKFPSQASPLCLQLTMFLFAFDKVFGHFPTGLQVAQCKYNYFLIPFRQKWLSLPVHNCSNRQLKKHANFELEQSWSFNFLETLNFLNCSISIDIKIPLNLASEANHYIFVFDDHFSTCIISVTTPKNCSLRCKHNNSSQDIKIWSSSKSDII